MKPSRSTAIAAITGMAMLSSIGMASAMQPLSDAELDSATAGATITIGHVTITSKGPIKVTVTNVKKFPPPVAKQIKVIKAQIKLVIGQIGTIPRVPPIKVSLPHR